MNEFEQICSDGHQMSLAGGLGPGGSPCLMYTGKDQGGRSKGVPMSDVQWGACTKRSNNLIMGNGHMGLPSPVD